ncbi:MAG: helix-turn-helix transcriptional regulator [Ruminococcus sp.]|nr:helix-turn-helix transcriptional regulator [Ruminococcus sp.]
MLIGEFLQKHMDEQHMSKAELSRRSGVPVTTIGSIISRNNKRVAIETLLKLCKVIGCDINEYIDTLLPEIAEEQKKFVPIETYKDEIYEQLNKLSYDELVELQQYLKFLQFKRDHPDEL